MAVHRPHDRTDAPATELAQIEDFWRDELATAVLYHRLAEADSDSDRAAVFRDLAAAEERHAAYWSAVLESRGRVPEQGALPGRVRLIAWVAEHFGVDRVLPTVIRGEASGREVYRDVPEAPDHMVAEETSHGRRLAQSTGLGVGPAISLAEGRHRTGVGGPLRAGVFGANDGLVSNLALIMGVAGGATDPATVVLAGIAGLVAGAGSMAAGEWVSVRSQRELYEREIAVERAELVEMPEEEREELELIYRAKGVAPDEARRLADRIMADPETALDTLVREELGLDPGDLGSPWSAAVSSFLAFATGAFIPLLPFLVASGPGAAAVAALLSGTALAAVGVAISIFTGRSAWWSALRMVLIGGVTAGVTYGIGTLVGVGIT